MFFVEGNKHSIRPLYRYWLVEIAPSAEWKSFIFGLAQGSGAADWESMDDGLGTWIDYSHDEMGRFFRYPLWRKFINRLALAGVCHFEHSEKSRRDPSSLCSVGMTPLGKLQHTSRKFSNSSRNFQFPRTQKLKYPRIFNEISAVTQWNIHGYVMKYPWIFEFLYTEIFVFGQMFGDFTEFSVEFSRRESWQYFAALCQYKTLF